MEEKIRVILGQTIFLAHTLTYDREHRCCDIPRFRFKRYGHFDIWLGCAVSSIYFLHLHGGLGKKRFLSLVRVGQYAKLLGTQGYWVPMATH